MSIFYSNVLVSEETSNVLKAEGDGDLLRGGEECQRVAVCNERDE